MTVKNITAKNKVIPKASLAIEVTSILTASLATFKEVLGENKFEKRIRKAAKLFAHGIKAVRTKNSAEKKAPLKKVKKKATKVPAKKL